MIRRCTGILLPRSDLSHFYCLFLNCASLEGVKGKGYVFMCVETRLFVVWCMLGRFIIATHLLEALSWLT